MDVAPIGDINSIVSKLPDKVALVPVGVPGVSEDPPAVTVIELVGVPKALPFPALKMIEVGGAPEVVKVPLPDMDEVVGVVDSEIVFQFPPPLELY